ncbi:MAG: hypothetical protein AAGC60_13070 [Acidobacteriota bacterium]
MRALQRRDLAARHAMALGSKGSVDLQTEPGLQRGRGGRAQTGDEASAWCSMDTTEAKIGSGHGVRKTRRKGIERAGLTGRVGT